MSAAALRMTLLPASVPDGISFTVPLYAPIHVTLRVFQQENSCRCHTAGKEDCFRAFVGKGVGKLHPQNPRGTFECRKCKAAFNGLFDNSGLYKYIVVVCFISYSSGKQLCSAL
jgi:hypothetical protein